MRNTSRRLGYSNTTETILLIVRYFGVPMYVTPGRERRRCSGVRRWKQRCGPLYPSPPSQADSLRHTTTQRLRSHEHEPIHTKTKQIPKLPPSDLVASRHGARLARCCASATKPRIMDPSNKAPPDQIFQVRSSFTLITLSAPNRKCVLNTMTVHPM